MGTPTIRPETSYQGDLSLKLSWARMTIRGGAFYRRIHDFITVALLLQLCDDCHLARQWFFSMSAETMPTFEA